MRIRTRSFVTLAAGLLLSVITSTSLAQSDSNSDARIKRLFQRSPEADANKDGVLTLKEAQAFLKEQRRKQPNRDAQRAQPTHADVMYGEHQRHAIDLYLVKSKQPTPLVIYIHGGGFVGGDKQGVSGRLIQSMHKAGISVAAIHYRFIREHRFPVPFTDSARAVQFLRHHAKKYNLDADRFAATGGSAGAGISLWLATHDDMADPKSDDPVSRQSTRISCASVGGAQVSYDPRFWREIGLAKGLQHSSFSLMYGVPSDDPFKDPKKIAIAEDCAPIEHVSRDDPPVYFQYGVPDELSEKTSLGAVVHHPRHGQLFKKKMDSLGIECHLVYPGGPKAKLSTEEFLIKHLTRTADIEQAFGQATSPADFARVARQYEQIGGDTFVSGAVLYNAGNARMRAGKRGRAIALYRQAQRYRPRDPYLAANLQNAITVGGRDALSPAESGLAGSVFFWQNWLSYAEKFTTATWLLGLTLVLSLLSQCTQHGALLRRVAFATAATCLLSAASTAWDWYRFELTTHGVVVTDSVVARKGNSENYEAAFTDPLSEGTEFVVLEDRADWLHVQIGDAGTGWLPQRDTAIY